MNRLFSTLFLLSVSCSKDRTTIPVLLHDEMAFRSKIKSDSICKENRNKIAAAQQSILILSKEKLMCLSEFNNYLNYALQCKMNGDQSSANKWADKMELAHNKSVVKSRLIFALLDSVDNWQKQIDSLKAYH